MTWLIPTAYVGFFLLLVRRFGVRRPQLRDYAPRPRGGLISVIIPARNEAANIEA